MRMNKIAIGASLLSALFVAGCGDSDSGIPFGSDSGSNPNNPITAPTAGNIAFSVLGGSATGTATVTLLGRGFFVSNQAAPGGTGTQQAPFQNLAQVQAAAAGVNGAEIVVSQGDGTNNGYNTAFALGANQTLRGFSQAATPLLTGPVTFSSGNRLEDVRISGTPGAASAVNAVGASNGIINRVAISNCTSAGNLTDATGTFAISNGSVQNTAAQGYIALSTTGSLNWSVTTAALTT
jgi:hypothetical protein